MTDLSTPSTIILLAHSALMPIDRSEMSSALSESDLRLPRSTVTIDVKDACAAAVESGDWTPVSATIRREYDANLAPPMAAHNVGLHYFGSVPVPAAMFLGYLVGSWTRVVPRLRHHVQKNWDWPSSTDAASQSVLRATEIREGSLAEGDVIIRVATSVAVDAQSTLQIVPRPLAQVDIACDPLGYDIFSSADQIHEVARRFRKTLDDISEAFPNVRAVHVFAAVPVGLAFAMGTQVTSTMHPSVYTYYFDQKAQPQHNQAITLQAPPVQRARLSDSDRQNAAAIRKSWSEELQQIRRYADNMMDLASAGKSGDWLQLALGSSSAARSAFTGRWLKLQPIHNTVLRNSAVDVTTQFAETEGFDYRSESRSWIFDDRLLADLAKRLSSAELLAQAGRMLLFHEGLHATSQGVTRFTSLEVGRFPKVLEVLDYHADVWALIHEWSLAKQHGKIDGNAAAARVFLLRAIDTALETFWAFDAGEGPLLSVQVRRLNRYLMWYWQYLRIANAGDSDDLFAILAQQPTIEIAGPEISTRDERIFYSLDARRVSQPELAVEHNCALYRFASGPASDMKIVLDGFRERDGELIKQGLRGFFDQVVRDRS